MSRSRGYQPALDGLRALAVVSVVLFHDVTHAFPGGFAGVDVFFVLSGYLITGILVSELDRRGGLRFGRFYLRRALRLLPALVTMCAALITAYVVLLHGADRRESVVPALAALLYASSPMAASGHDLGSMLHAWSLSVEEYFYLVWPGLLLLIARGRGRLVWVAGLTAAAVAYRLGTALAGWDLDRIYYAADTRAEQLLIGALLALLLPRSDLAVGRALASRPPALVGAMLLAGFVLLPNHLTAPFYRYGGSTLLALGAACVVGHVVARTDGLLARGLSCRPLTWVGKRSYGVYLWGPPISALAAFAMPAAVPPGARLMVVLALTLAVPAFSYAVVERPFLRLKDKPPETEVVAHVSAVA